MDTDIEYEYFFGGFWQTCKMIDFYSQGDSGILYSIDFKGSLLMVFQ